VCARQGSAAQSARLGANMRLLKRTLGHLSPIYSVIFDRTGETLFTVKKIEF
jgi:hypothetical protein